MPQRHVQLLDVEINSSIVCCAGSSCRKKYTHLDFLNVCHTELLSVSEQWTIFLHPNLYGSIFSGIRCAIVVKMKHLAKVKIKSYCTVAPVNTVPHILQTPRYFCILLPNANRKLQNARCVNASLRWVFIVIDVGVLEEPATIAGRCHQRPSMLDAFSMQQNAVQSARAVLRPPARMMPSSMHASVRTFVMPVELWDT